MHIDFVSTLPARTRRGRAFGTCQLCANEHKDFTIRRLPARSHRAQAMSVAFVAPRRKFESIARNKFRLGGKTSFVKQINFD
jgi:hypothetical protein